MKNKFIEPNVEVLKFQCNEGIQSPNDVHIQDDSNILDGGDDEFVMG